MGEVGELRAVVGRIRGWRVVLKVRWNIQGLLTHELIRSANISVNARIEMYIGAAEESP